MLYIITFSVVPDPVCFSAALNICFSKFLVDLMIHIYIFLYVVRSLQVKFTHRELGQQIFVL